MRPSGDSREIVSAVRAVRDAALEAAALLAAIDPLIQQDTSAVCPSCADVCCIARHGRYAQDDIVYLSALGKDIPEDSADLDDKAPCRFLGSDGCIMPRVMRPFRCTWYFCPALMEIVQGRRPREIRAFYEMLQAITVKRQQMLEAFAETERRLPLRNLSRPDDQAGRSRV